MPRRSARWLVIAACTFFPFAILTDTGSGAKDPDAKAAKPVALLDAQGDPLPEGAVARLGTYRYHFMNSQCFASLSGDGKILGLGSRDGTIRLLEAASGKEIRRAGQELIGGSAFALNADGTVLVSLGNGGNMLLWDTVANKGLHTLEVKKGTRPTSVTISANGKVVTAGIQGAFRQTNTVDAWEVATGKVLCSCEVLHSSNIRATLSADGKQLATWGYANAVGKENPGQIIQVWSTASGVETWQLKDEPSK
jgi:WD40 repeat protein